jgi:hypothetical protein
VEGSQTPAAIKSDLAAKSEARIEMEVVTRD